MSSFSLNALGLRCRKPNALKPCGHTHTHIRGRATVNGVKDVSIATFSGAYTAEITTVYAKEVARACKTTARPVKIQTSGLMELASSSPVASGTAPVAGIRNERCGVLDCLYGQDNTRVFELRAGGMCMDLDDPHGESVHFSKLQGCKNTALRHYQGSAPAPMAVTGPPKKAGDYHLMENRKNLLLTERQRKDGEKNMKEKSRNGTPTGSRKPQPKIGMRSKLILTSTNIAEPRPMKILGVALNIALP